MAKSSFSIMSRVAAEFRSKEGGVFVAKPLQIYNNVPEWIKNDRLYELLLKDGSLEVITTASAKRALENDPNANTTPDGKAKAPAESDKSSKGDKPDENPGDAE